MADAFTFERIAVIERTLEDARRRPRPAKPWPVSTHAGGERAVLRDLLGSICGANDALVGEIVCLARLRKIVADARIAAPGPSPVLAILEHILETPLGTPHEDIAASARVLAIADVALALFRLSESARE